jgi:SPP1 family phage portal protein
MSFVEKIQYKDEFLNEANINQNISVLWGKALPIFMHRKYLQDRFTRKYDKKDVVVALEYYISIIASGYFGGKEPQFKVKNINETQKGILNRIFKRIFGEKNDPKDYQAIIDYIAKYNDNGSFFYDCVLDYITTGACYGLVYENKYNEEVYANVSSLNTVAIWNYDVPSTKIGLLRCWYENTATGGIETHLEIITKDYKKQFVDGIEKKTITENAEYNFEEVDGSNKPVRWTDLPCFAVENPYGMAFFENVMTLINKNEKVIENNANIFDYNDNAKLKVTGFSPMNDPLIPLLNDKGEEQKDKEGNVIMTKNPARVQEDEAILNAKVFYTPDKEGDIDWIIKDINDTASENHKKTCLDMALMISGVPNVTDQGFTDADNAAALEKKFFPLEQVLQQAHHLFRKEYLRMWEMITARINLKKNKEYDFRDIDVILIRNLPTDTESLTNAWLKLRGLISDKSIISHLPFGLDAESEIAEMDKQNEENIQKNLQQMQMMGQTGVEQDNKEDKQDDKVTDLTDTQKVQKLTAYNKKEQTKVGNKQINKE